jgi:hypothetical protein
MKRLELIACEAVRMELVDGLEKAIDKIEYTLLAGIEGKGLRARKDGSQVWPELNFMLICYMGEAELATAKQVILDVSKKFPNEGIFAGAVDAERIK